MSLLSRTGRLAIVALPGLLLMGCGSYSRVPTMNEANMQGSDFNHHLARDYKVLANYEAYEMQDWRDATTYAERSMAANNGNSGPPDDLSARHIEGDDKVAELRVAHGRLTQALAAGAAQKSPRSTASAQSNFDCWVEQQEEGHQPAHIAACKNGFWQAMNVTETAMAAEPASMVQQPETRQPEFFRVFFDWDRSDLTADARRMIDQAIQRSRSQGQDIRLIGHTDSTGNDSYNMHLSQRRAETVKAYLIVNDVPRETITTIARGERDQQVQTADGVREAENRSVSIAFSTRQAASN